MAYPTPPATAIPNIAADTNYDAAGEDWHATPTKVTPSAAVLAQGFVPGDLRLPMYDNFLFSWIRAWVVYVVAYCDELLAQKVQGPASSTDNALARFDSTTGKIIQNSALTCADTTGVCTYAVAQAGGTTVGFDGGNPIFGTWTRGEAGAMLCSTNDGTFTVPISDLVPEGATLTTIDLLMLPGTTRATVGERTSYELVEQVRAFGTPGTGTRTSIGTVTDAGTNVLQTVPVMSGGAVASAKASGKLIFLVITAGDNAGASNDTFYAMKLAWTVTRATA
jgi:hypothetical protein